jgi:hypothetical protein
MGRTAAQPWKSRFLSVNLAATIRSHFIAVKGDSIMLTAFQMQKMGRTPSSHASEV